MKSLGKVGNKYLNNFVIEPKSKNLSTSFRNSHLNFNDTTRRLIAGLSYILRFQFFAGGQKSGNGDLPFSLTRTLDHTRAVLNREHGLNVDLRVHVGHSVRYCVPKGRAGWVNVCLHSTYIVSLRDGRLGSHVCSNDIVSLRDGRTSS